MANINNLIYGKDTESHIVAIEPYDDHVEIFTEQNGTVSSRIDSNFYYILCPKNFNGTTRLNGQQYYKYIKKFDNRDDFIDARKRSYKADCWSIYDAQESHMVITGRTLFKGMKVEDVSVLSFDIETTGIVHNKDSKILLISNTFLKQGKITKKLFAYDDFISQGEMIEQWCEWVRTLDPSVLTGHNIFGYDLRYMDYVAQMNGTTLALGRDNSDIKFNDYTSGFRKDGSQSYDYYNAYVYGRQIIDTMFLSIKYDIGRKYDSYGLKAIIAHEGLEKEGRQFYDAATIKDNYQIPEEWKKIKDYAMDDADDALALYKLMIPSFFYWTQSIPMSFQSVINKATGSQVNSMMVRSYLQDDHSIAKASEVEHIKGGISFAVPNVYKNLYKVDLKSAYPSQIIRFKLHDKNKDPKQHLYLITKHFTEERLKNKTLAIQTGERYYSDIEQSQKIGINSMFGFLGAPGLNYNSGPLAEKITYETREVINQALVWASGKNVDYWMNLFKEKTDV